jgi:FkbH-like protein
MTDENGPEIKCVVWDLDNTLWEGTLLEGDDLKLRPGIARILRTLDERGVLNSVASKNDLDAAEERLRGFGLWDYFLYPQINWNAKSASVARIREHINIGMGTLLFIDDQPYERDEVQSVHPQVTCMDARDYLQMPEWPRLNPRFVTPESRRRRLMYREDQARRESEIEFRGPRRDFLESLRIELAIAPAAEGDLERAAELTVRTHQLNATGITYSREELERFRKAGDHLLLMCDMRDRYGHLGKVGLGLVEITPEHWRIRLLLMSCRVMSFGLGSVLLTYIQKEAHRQGKTVLADFRHTERNRQMFIAYKFARFKEVRSRDGWSEMQNDPDAIPDYPTYVRLQTGRLP